jgi:alkylated DNA repair protein (DNA oxidative demethylase)
MLENNNQELSERLEKSGVFLFRRFLNNYSDRADAGIPTLARVLEDVRGVIRQAPLFTPRMFDSRPFRYRMSNCGALGWLSSPNQDECKAKALRGYYYSKINPYTGNPWPKMPESIREASLIATRACGWPDFNPETCLINFYQNRNERLGIHQDNTENNEEAPVVSFSIGDTGLFQIGALSKSVELEDILLESGDCLVLSGASRLFYHKFARLLPGTSTALASGGRLNLTVRQVN